MDRAEYAANPKYCVSCNEPIPFEKRMNTFCGKACAAKANGRVPKGLNRSPKHCKHCGALVGERHNKYCDDCIARRVYDPKSSANMALAELKTDSTRRKWLLERREHKCEHCGLTQWQGRPIPLELHHEDGDTDNNTEENLRLICPNCHALTHTHRRRNILKNGKRQLMRRKRYADGKTW